MSATSDASASEDDDGESVDSSLHTQYALPAHHIVLVANISLMPPIIFDASNGSKSQKPAVVHRGVFKFSSPLGWEISIIREASLQALFAICHHRTRVGAEIVISTTGCGKSIYYVIYLHDRNDSGSFC